MYASRLDRYDPVGNDNQRDEGMTDMTPEEINDMLARWVGFEGSGLNNTFNDPPNSNPYHCHILPTPDYFGSNAAMDLLGVLVERGYTYTLQDNIHGAGHGLFIWRRDDTLNELADSSYQPTIPAAICHAILGMIEMEGLCLTKTDG